MSITSRKFNCERRSLPVKGLHRNALPSYFCRILLVFLLVVRRGEGTYKGLMEMCVGWGRIFTTGLTIMGLHFY